MKRIYDYYGSRETDTKRVSDVISAASGASFALRHSSYAGVYYLANIAQGQEITIEPNELEDEHGKFLRRPEYDRYNTIVTVKQVKTSDTEPSSFLDSMREKLHDVEGLVFLRRNEPSRRASPPAGSQ